MHREVGVYTVCSAPINSTMKPIVALGGGETIRQVYDRLPSPKPDILINGNMYNMATRQGVQGLRIDDTVYSPANYGGHLLISRGGKYSVEKHPNIALECDWAMEGTGMTIPYNVAGISSSFVNNKHARTSIGITNNEIKTISTTIPVLFSDLVKIHTSEGVKQGLNLDGGGSVGVIHEGKVIIGSSRKNVNYIGIWYPKSSSEPKPSSPNKIVFEHVPTLSKRVTSPFGNRSGGFHDGVDIGALQKGVEGDKLYAVADGVISISKIDGAGLNRGYGYYIVVKHKGFSTLYGHLQGLDVKVGQRVKAGDVIGRMGNTGSSTGAHVHFRLSNEENIRFTRDGNGKTHGSINPQPYIDAVVDLPIEPTTPSSGDYSDYVKVEDIVLILEELLLKFKSLNK